MDIAFYVYTDEELASTIASYVKSKVVSHAEVSLKKIDKKNETKEVSKDVAVDKLGDEILGFLSLPTDPDLNFIQLYVEVPSINTTFIFNDIEYSGSSTQEDFKDVFGKFGK